MAECRLIRGGRAFHGKQGLDYVSGIPAETVGADAICMHLLEVPPGTSAKRHYHEAHETAILVLAGSGKMLHGPNLDEVMEFEAGDFVYIPRRSASAVQPCLGSHRSERAGECRRARAGREPSSTFGG